MKFPQLSIGQRFEWRGRLYSKNGPVAATDLATGQSQLIPRSAVVSLPDAPPPAPPKRPPGLSRAQMEPLLAEYRRATLAWAESHLEPDVRQALAQAMEAIAREMAETPDDERPAR